MATFRITRPTIYQADINLPPDDYKELVPDRGRRRHLSFSLDFDTRAVMLGTKIQDHWDAPVKDVWVQNHQNIEKGLIFQFGADQFEQKRANFLAIDSKPMSVVSYHNAFYDQIRHAFVMGQYYPALVAACALGERILNHLILDMRPYFKHIPEYKQIYRKDSFDRWEIPIDILESWNVLLSTAVTAFRELKELRHRSIHFNVSTYASLRDDALAANLLIRTIIEQQFDTWGLRPWFIQGTLGHIFIRKAYESDPFVKVYFLSQSPFVGPLFGLRPLSGGWEVMDVPDYGDGEWTDEEFAEQYNNRKPDDVLTVPPEVQWA